MKLIETIKATFSSEEPILDLNIAGNYAKGVVAFVVFLLLFRMEESINIVPMARQTFTLIGLGVVVWHGATKQRRAIAKEWILIQVDRIV